MKNEYKNIFNSINPSDELEKKVLELNNSDRQIKFEPKRIIAVAAAIAILVTGSVVGLNSIGNKINIAPQTSVNDDSQGLLDFTVVAYANDDVSNAKEIKNSDITLMDYKIKVKKDSDGAYAITGSSESEGLAIKADDDIESVTFECENGEFSYIDNPLRQHMVRQNKYYSAVIPLTKEQYDDYNNLIDIAQDESDSTMPYKQKFVKDIIDQKDCSECIYDDNFNPDYIGETYSVYVSDMAGEEEHYYDYCLLIRGYDQTQAIFKNNSNKLVAKTYQDGDKIEGVYYFPFKLCDYIIDNIDTFSFEELPEDIITITVKYKSGQSIKKQILAKFNNDGVLTMQYK